MLHWYMTNPDYRIYDVDLPPQPHASGLLPLESGNDENKTRKNAVNASRSPSSLSVDPKRQLSINNGDVVMRTNSVRSTNSTNSSPKKTVYLNWEYKKTGIIRQHISAENRLTILPLSFQANAIGCFDILQQMPSSLHIVRINLAQVRTNIIFINQQMVSLQPFLFLHGVSVQKLSHDLNGCLHRALRPSLQCWWCKCLLNAHQFSSIASLPSHPVNRCDQHAFPMVNTLCVFQLFYFCVIIEIYMWRELKNKYFESQR